MDYSPTLGSHGRKKTGDDEDDLPEASRSRSPWATEPSLHGQKQRGMERLRDHSQDCGDSTKTVVTPRVSRSGRRCRNLYFIPGHSRIKARAIQPFSLSTARFGSCPESGPRRKSSSQT